MQVFFRSFSLTCKAVTFQIWMWLVSCMDGLGAALIMTFLVQHQCRHIRLCLLPQGQEVNWDWRTLPPTMKASETEHVVLETGKHHNCATCSQKWGGELGPQHCLDGGCELSGIHMNASAQEIYMTIMWSLLVVSCVKWPENMSFTTSQWHIEKDQGSPSHLRLEEFALASILLMRWLHTVSVATLSLGTEGSCNNTPTSSQVDDLTWSSRRLLKAAAEWLSPSLCLRGWMCIAFPEFWWAGPQCDGEDGPAPLSEGKAPWLLWVEFHPCPEDNYLPY